MIPEAHYEAQMTEVRNLLAQKDHENRMLQQSQTSIFGGINDQNLIQWQLDLKEELERIDHLLRGHILKRDKDGNEVYMEPEDNTLKPFNDFGVQLLLNIISFYLNRNTILSNYDEEMINWKMKDLGDEITDIIFMKYEEMGMDTKSKRKMYPLIVRELVDTVHSAYLRALNGGERDSLRTARTVSQTEPMGQQQAFPMSAGPQRKFSLFKPTSWIR